MHHIKLVLVGLSKIQVKLQIF